MQGVLLFFVLAIFASTLLVEVDELMQQLNDRNDPRHQPYSEGLRLALKLMVTMVLICWLLMLVGIIADFVLCGLPSNMLSPIARSGRRIMTQLRRRRQFVVLPFRAQSKKQPALELQPSPSGRSMMIGPVEAKAKQPARGEVRDTKVTTGGAAEAKQKLAAQPRADAAANAAVTTPRVQPASKQPIPRATNIRDGMALKAQGGATLPADTREDAAGDPGQAASRASRRATGETKDHLQTNVPLGLLSVHKPTAQSSTDDETAVSEANRQESEAAEPPPVTELNMPPTLPHTDQPVETKSIAAEQLASQVHQPVRLDLDELQEASEMFDEGGEGDGTLNATGLMNALEALGENVPATDTDRGPRLRPALGSEQLNSETHQPVRLEGPTACTDDLSEHGKAMPQEAVRLEDTEEASQAQPTVESKAPAEPATAPAPAASAAGTPGDKLVKAEEPRNASPAAPADRDSPIAPVKHTGQAKPRRKRKEMVI